MLSYSKILLSCRTNSNVDDNLLPLATAFGLRWKDLKVISKEVRDRTFRRKLGRGGGSFGLVEAKEATISKPVEAGKEIPLRFGHQH